MDIESTFSNSFAVGAQTGGAERLGRWRWKRGVALSQLPCQIVSSWAP